ERGEAPDAVAAFVLGTAAESVRRATEAARQRFGPLPVLFSGGVSSSRFLRARLGDLPSAVFGTPAASADNAMGIAWLTAAAARRRNESEQRGACDPWTPSPSPN
ncbi:MAG: hypothetical protein IJL69_05760, partial [Oscillospiraceae bacterium]|nr:hypothetical protein [Oscillospiraceae bacterium]